MESVTGFRVIFVRFGDSDPPAATVTIGGRTWRRAKGEVEAAFLERAMAEAARAPSGVTVAILDLAADAA